MKVGRLTAPETPDESVISATTLPSRNRESSDPGRRRTDSPRVYRPYREETPTLTRHGHAGDVAAKASAGAARNR